MENNITLGIFTFNITNHTIVGVIYSAMGLFGIVENGLTAIFIATDRQMQNPTYIYMINLCICDTIALFSIAIYSGMVLIFPSFNRLIWTKIGSYVIAITWYGACQFIVLMSFSRYIQLTSAHKMSKYFKKRNLILSIVLPWALPIVCYFWLFFDDKLPFTFFVDRCSWHFDENQYAGRFISFLTIALISALILTVNFFNVKTLLHVHRMRKQVHTFETHANAVREIKLFAQCAITGTLFTVAAVTYFVVSALKDRMDTIAFVVAHCMWILNALQYPVIYFALNSRLRERLFLFFCPLCAWIKNRREKKRADNPPRNVGAVASLSTSQL